MANDFTKRPLQIDTAGEGTDFTVRPSHVIIYPTAATWVCLLTDVDGGKKVLDVAGATADSYEYDIHQPPTKVWAETLTNCRLLLYVE